MKLVIILLSVCILTGCVTKEEPIEVPTKKHRPTKHYKSNRGAYTVMPQMGDN